MDKKQFREFVKKLEDIKAETSTPLTTYALFRDAVGVYNATEVVAALVHHSAWDGRIDRRNAEWAETVVLNHLIPDDIIKVAYSNMHLCHLDQIADYARKLY